MNKFGLLYSYIAKLFLVLVYYLQKRTIDKSYLFTPDYAFFLEDDQEKSINKYIQNYYQGHFLGRKPTPGFHPGIYSLYNSHDGIEPFVDFIRKGKPRGPWMMELIRPDEFDNKIVNSKCINIKSALHLHFHYFERVDNIIKRISQIKAKPDLKISVTSKDAEYYICQITSKYDFASVDVRLVPNRGRDIGPLLSVFNDVLQEYDVIGHFHEKKSLLVKNRILIDRWINFLEENIIGNIYPMADLILKKINDDPLIGLVFPDDPNIVGWTENKAISEKLATKMGIPLPLPEAINFPIGTVFWARTKALKPLFDLNLRFENYPEEPVPYDGTILHAIERIIPLVVNHSGFKTISSYVPGISR